ncbi:MAG: type II toxin-antitoxin system VapC family toxin [Burkholderiaceae bacterium]
MKLLIDTHLLLWAAAQPERLPKAATDLMLAPENTLLFSAASLWEIAIKASLGREDFTVDAARLRRGLVDNGYDELPISGAHALATRTLPPVHSDPFDRMLVAQARAEACELLTADRTLGAYGGSVRVV